MKVLITGGCGFIGSYLTERFLSNNYDVRVFGRKCDTKKIEHLLPNKKIEILRGDINNISDCMKAVNGCDYICHLATSLDEKNELFWQTNVGGTFNILEATRRAKIKKFLFMSLGFATRRWMMNPQGQRITTLKGHSLSMTLNRRRR